MDRSTEINALERPAIVRLLEALDDLARHDPWLASRLRDLVLRSLD
jgi:hypothetical protein